jgi:hypothetical protein
MNLWTLPLALGLSAVALAGALAAEPPAPIIIKQNPRELKPGQVYFDQKHNDAWAADALKEVSGSAAPAGATPAQMAALVQAQLDKLPAYGEKGVAMVQPIAPWFLDGYRRYNGGTVQRSRYFNGVLDGSLEPEADIAALYAYWSLYDAEWFSLSRTPGFKAWLSAVALTYPPDWLRLQGESQGALHSRLVTPLQTKDEPYREIDNWISSFKRQDNVGGHGQLGAFIKPKVRDALVQELLASAGWESDPRFYEQPSYSGGAPQRVGLSDRQFFLLGALTLEYFQEIYAASPQTKQPLFFRDYFVEAFKGAPTS